MKNIDFLPPRYREQNHVRRRHVWRFGVLATFTGVVFALLAFHVQQRRSVVRALAGVQEDFREAQTRSEAFGELRRELARAKHEALLVAYLKHPWPTSRLLHDVQRAAPPDVVLSEIQVLYEAAGSAETGGRRPPPRRNREEVTQGSPAQHDLRELHATWDPQQRLVIVRGTAAEPAAVHRFVAQLHPSPLFTKVGLESLEADQDEPQVTRFRLRIEVRPGFAHPDGPTAPLERLTSGESGETPAGEGSAL